MLNKPTNVSPYNVFLDINKGLELSFELNNTVDSLCVDIYKDDNTPIFTDFIDNTSKRVRNFSYSVSLGDLGNVSNNNNYYWKTRYWKTPLEENKKDEPNNLEGKFMLNYWDENTGVLGLYSPEQVCINEKNDGSGDSYQLRYNAGLIENQYRNEPVNYGETTTYIYSSQGVNSFWVDYLSRSGKNKKYLYICGTNIDGNKIFGYAYVKEIISFNYTGAHYITYECPSDEIYIMGEKISKENYKQLFGVQMYFYELSLENLSFNIGDYICLNHQNGNGIYKIKSININTYDGVPSIGLSVDCSIFGLGASEYSGIPRDDIGVSMYSKAEYNESPPYYFSCRETPDIDIYDISTNTPQIRMRANLKKYVDINSYRYQVYRLKDSNKWDLLWQSEKISTIKNLSDGTFNTETVIYNGIAPQNTYKVKIMGQTVEGQDFEVEKMFLSEDFSPTQTKDFISFNRDLGCVEIDNSAFIALASTYNLQIYRYNTLKDEMRLVAVSSYDFNSIQQNNGYCKHTITYDFNIISDAAYVYYAYIMDDDIIMGRYMSEPITPSWNGVYLNDVAYENSLTYIPDPTNVWFIGLNYESGNITRNYQVSHHHGIGQKYPKSTRGDANFKTGQVSGLLGKVSCTSGEYDEKLYLIEDFDSFCANGKLKLLRSSVKGEQLIADIDSMSSSEFTQGVTSVNLSYTQIDDITRKQISVEV